MAGGLQIVDITNPLSPVKAAQFVRGGMDIHSVETYRNKVFICGGSAEERFPGEVWIPTDDIYSDLRELLSDGDYAFGFSMFGGGSMTTYKDNQPYLQIEQTGTGQMEVTDKYGEKIADIKMSASGEFTITLPDGETMDPVGPDTTFEHPGVVYGFEISDPGNPEQISEINTDDNFVGSIEIDAGYLYYVEAFSGRIRKVNIEGDPSSVERVFDLPQGAESEPFSLLVHDGYAYFNVFLNGTYKLGVNSPAPVGVLSETGQGWIQLYDIQEQYAFYSEPMAGLSIGDMTDRNEFVRVSKIQGVYPESLLAAGNTLYCVNDGWIKLIDISNAASPEVTGSYSALGNPGKAIFKGDYFYILDNSNGVVVVNNRNPAQPILSSAIEMQAPRDAMIGGNYMYVAAYPGIKIVDISSPSDPTIIKTYDMDDMPSALYLDENNLYMVNNNVPNFGLYALDVSDPRQPMEMNWITIPGDCSDLVIADGYAYVANKDNGVTVVDIEPVDGAHVIETIGLNDRPTTVEYFDGYIIATGSDAMLSVLNTNANGHLELIKEISMRTRLRDLFIDGGMLYLADTLQDVQVYSLDPVSDMQLSDTLHFDFRVASIIIHGNYAYVTGTDDTFHIVNIR